MKYRILILTITVLFLVPKSDALAQDWPDGLEVMKRIDFNMVSENH